jgi:hypothetical protein
MATQLSVDQVLCLTQHELAQFLEQNNAGEGDNLAIFNITDWDKLSKAKRDLLAAHLL